MTSISSKIESFIRSKYESKRWAMDGPLPEDPKVLESIVPQAQTVKLIMLFLMVANFCAVTS